MSSKRYKLGKCCDKTQEAFGANTDSHRGRHRLWAHWECLQPFSTIRTSSVERREYKPGAGPTRGDHRGPGDHEDHKGGISGTCLQQPTLGSVCRGVSHLESEQFSRPPAPLPRAVSSHPTLSSKNTAEAEKFITTPKATVSHWQEKTEFWVRVPPSCPAEGREELFSYSGAGNPPPMPTTAAPGPKDHPKAGRDRCQGSRHQHPRP